MIYLASYRATACICATANTIPDIAHKPAGCGAAPAIRRPERGLTSRPNSAKRNAEDLRRSRRIPRRYKLSPAHQTNQPAKLTNHLHRQSRLTARNTRTDSAARSLRRDRTPTGTPTALIHDRAPRRTPALTRRNKSWRAAVRGAAELGEQLRAAGPAPRSERGAERVCGAAGTVSACEVWRGRGAR